MPAARSRPSAGRSDRRPQDIPDLPDKDYFVTVIGDISVAQGGAYEFCSPNKDGSAPRTRRRRAPDGRARRGREQGWGWAASLSLAGDDPAREREIRVS